MTVYNGSKRDVIRALRDAYRIRSSQLDAINVASPWHRLYREATTVELDRALPKSRCRVLDAGGGTGIFSKRLAELGHDVVLVDILPKMRALASKKAKAMRNSGYTFDVVEGDLENLSFLATGSFDFVLCTQVLNFCPNLGRVLSELSRVLRPDGILFADIDNAYRWAVIEALDGHLDNAIGIMSAGKDLERRINGAAYFFHSRPTLEEELTGAGFQVEALWGLLFIAAYIHTLARSQEFLDPELLSARTRLFLDPGEIAKLRQLEAIASQQLPTEAGAWFQFRCRKPGVTSTDAASTMPGA